MKINKLIRILKAAKEKHGNIRVMIRDPDDLDVAIDLDEHFVSEITEDGDIDDYDDEAGDETVFIFG